MTVSSTVNQTSYAGNGVTTLFAVPFYFLEASHLRVTLIDNATSVGIVQTLNVNYTVTGAGNQAGGSITMSAAPANGKTLLIVRVVPATQDTDYVSNDPFPAETHERALDKLTMIAQQTGTAVSKALRVQDYDPEPARLPGAAQRANQLLSFATNGDPIAVAPVSGSATDLAISLANEADPSKGAAQVGRSDQIVGTIAELRGLLKGSPSKFAAVLGYYAIGDGGGGDYYLDVADITSADNGGSVIVASDGGRWKLSYLDTLSVKQFGARGDGVADDAPSFRAALAATPAGGTILIPRAPLAYLMNSVAPGGAILDFTDFPNKCVTFQGYGWTLKTGGSFSYSPTAGPRGSVIRLGPSLPSTADFYHQAPTDLTVGGARFLDFAVTSFTGAYGDAYGRHGLHFDGTANIDGYFENTLVENVFIDNLATGYSIFVNGVGNAHGVFAGAVFRNSKFMNFNAPALGDSVTIEYNTIGANAIVDARNIGVYFYNVSGATSTRILNNNMVNANGMIICDGAVKPVIYGNEFEQSLLNTAGILVWLRGSVAPVDTPTVDANSISSNVIGQTYAPLFIAQSNNARVSSNRMSTPTNYAAIQIASTSVHTVVEADNTQWAGGLILAAVNLLDAGSRSILRGQPWTTYTPTATPSGGAFGSITVTGAYQLRDTKTLAFRIDLTITSVGTATGSVILGLPVPYVGNGAQAVNGIESAVTAKGINGFITNGSGTIAVTDSAGASAIGANHRLLLTGTIEVQ